MVKKKQNKKKKQQTIEHIGAQSLAQRFPLYETGRNTVGFLNGMVSQELTDRITDLFRGHSRAMQGEIADSIRIYVLYQAVDLSSLF